MFLLASLVERQPWAREYAATTRHACRARARGDHDRRRAADLARVARRLDRARAMPSVRELSALYENVMLGPRRGPGVCGTCFNFTDGYDAVLRVRSRPAGPRRGRADLLQRRARAASSRARELQAPATATSPAGSGASLAAILWRFLAEHERCVARGAGTDRFELVTTVPSGDRVRATSVIRSAGSSASSSRRPAPATSDCCGRSDADVQPRAFSAGEVRRHPSPSRAARCC